MFLTSVITILIHLSIFIFLYQSPWSSFLASWSTFVENLFDLFCKMPLLVSFVILPARSIAHHVAEVSYVSGYSMIYVMENLVGTESGRLTPINICLARHLFLVCISFAASMHFSGLRNNVCRCWEWPKDKKKINNLWEFYLLQIVIATYGGMRIS